MVMSFITIIFPSTFW